MKRLKRIFILTILTIILIINSNMSFAIAEIQIISNKDVFEAEEEAYLKIEIKDASIAALTLEIYWDRAKLEYLSGPENSNNLNNRVIYTWVNGNGQNSDVINIEMFKFKTLQDGTANIAVTGEFYNINGDRIEINDSNLEIKIGKENEEVKEPINEQNKNISDDNTNLSILRLNEEGINPDFNKDIKEYYFVTDKAINNLEITAIPENSGATVTISGNDNLKMGENTIDIKVESKDKSKTSIYKIYVTKTNNLELANANLETLAIRQGVLEPEFDSNMTQYKVEIANDINNIDILAIPQRENATVKIIGNGEMKEGDNKIEVIILAENCTTNKKYNITVHRRNEEEELKNKQDKEYQAERLSAILEEKENQNQNETIEAQNEKTKNNIIVIILIAIAVIVSCAIIYKYKIKNKKEN